jgi:hypothetical protein
MKMKRHGAGSREKGDRKTEPGAPIQDSRFEILHSREKVAVFSPKLVSRNPQHFPNFKLWCTLGTPNSKYDAKIFLSTYAFC